MTTDYIALAREKERLRAEEARSEPGIEPVVFTGSAREFFGIWIVNLLLSVLTLGIYAAWAKVRTQRYFARNLQIGGRRFDYHATGMQILIGRIIIVAAFVAISIVIAAVPAAMLAVYPLLILLFPYVIVRSLRFTARNTSWSNVRFDFSGGYGGALMTHVVLPIGVALTAYTTGPFLTRARQSFFVSNHHLGDRAFSFERGIGGYYLAVLLAGMVMIILSAGTGVLLGPSLFAWLETAFAPAGAAPPEPPVGMLVLIYAALFLVFYPTVLIYKAMVRNLMYAGATLEGGHRFGSHVSPPRLIWIAISNAAAVVCTLGLALPWAQVRMVRYLADSTVVLPNGSFDDIAGRIEADHGAVGEAYTDLEGIDFGGVGI